MWNINNNKNQSSFESSPSPKNRNNNNMQYYNKRRAYHSGSWYTSNKKQLDEQLTQFISNAEADNATAAATQPQPLRACIVPHAGFSYSGTTAGYSYNEIQKELSTRCNDDRNKITTILILHPSHHVALSRCDVSGANTIGKFVSV